MGTKKIEPVGNKILVMPSPTEYEKTEGGIEVQNDIEEGIVVEVSKDLQGVYKPGDVVLYPKGAGQSQYYNGKNCIWLVAKTFPEDGEVWGIVTESK